MPETGCLTEQKTMSSPALEAAKSMIKVSTWLICGIDSLVTYRQLPSHSVLTMRVRELSGVQRHDLITSPNHHLLHIGCQDFYIIQFITGVT
jgi:hypothetical protein